MKKKSSISQRFILLVVILATAWGGGLLWFIHIIPHEGSASLPSRVDGIVALTGGSQRINAGISLLGENKAKKLLISGVGAGARLEEVISTADPRLKPLLDTLLPLADYIETGYLAADTQGNAVETLSWMEFNDYTSVIIVTADYHAPRALFELRTLMPEKEIYTYTVLPDNVYVSAWWRYPGTTRLIASEYNKYLLAQMRVYFLGT